MAQEELKSKMLMQVIGYGMTTMVLLILLVVDLLIPDPLPVVDEAILTLATGLAGSATTKPLRGD